MTANDDVKPDTAESAEKNDSVNSGYSSLTAGLFLLSLMIISTAYFADLRSLINVKSLS
jgi:hypothetical protein